MNIIFPMNGTGERFRIAGYEGPKYFLPVLQSTMIQEVSAIYPEYWSRAFAVWHEDADELAKYFPHDKIIKIYERTFGPVHTLMKPEIIDYISSCEDIVVADCDSFIGDIEDIATEFIESDADACSPIRQAKERWASYCRIDNELIVETREKDPFTKWSTTGPYFWRSGKKYIECAKASGITDNSPLFNELIKRQGSVIPIKTDNFYHIGTPELYRNFINAHS